MEFIRRFLLHSLPAGFVRICHYGFLANRHRRDHLAKIKRAMGLATQSTLATDSLQQMMLKMTGIDIALCSSCKKGSMQTVAEIRKISSGCLSHIIQAPIAAASAAA